MGLLRIYADTRAPGICRSCGRPIEWAELMSGARHPFDPPIRPIRSQSVLMGGRVVEEVDTTTSSTHFATCPDAAKWRKKR
jgi:hypothetical protein